ncbi:MAG TPA: hypothetical protein PLR26_05170 [Bacilli bacterium]|nr:hypothetical protein [Bacilli bacterium]
MNNFDVIIAAVKIVEKSLNFPAPELFIIERSKLPNSEITGMYKYDSNKIIFSKDWILRSHWTEVIITVFHEMRHAYQGYCIRTQSRETKETLDKWEFETVNYIMPSGKNNETDDEAYLKQEIEIDAIVFAHKMMIEHFELKTIIPSSIKNLVITKI